MTNTIDRGSFSPDDISQWFWDLVRKSGQSRGQLLSLLESMSREEIIRFDNEFQEAATQLADDPFFEFMDADISEDGAKDVADFVVSQGKDFYSNVWRNPARIPAKIPPGEAKSLSGVAAKYFWERFQERIPRRNDRGIEVE
jgi:hypothetical protein